MPLANIVNNVIKAIRSNSPEILTALGVSGVLTTAYLTAKASFRAAGKLENQDPRMSTVDKTKIVWTLYIPAALSGAVTVGCIVGARQIGANRTAAAVAAYSLTEKAFVEYKEKVIEQIGKNKEEKIRDDIAQDHISKNPPTKEIVVLGGQVLCCELYTQRYFRSTMQALQKAENEVNSWCITQRYVTLDDFYSLIGLRHTQMSNKVGWEADRLLELEFSTVLSEDGEPCLAFNYSYVKPIE